MDPDAVLGGLDDAQRAAVTSPAMPLAVIAPAGSGKTRVLTARVAHRIASGDAEPSHVLCVTFTRKAATELRTRLHHLGLHERIEAGTFHGVAWRLLQDRWAAAGRTAPQLLDRSHAFLAEQVAPEARPAEISDLANEISWARARMIRPDAYEEAARRAGRRPRRPAAWVAERYATYETTKSKRHVVDFDDLLAACTSAMHGDLAFAAAQRWRFRHLFVDEFQDVNPLQFALLEAWRGDRWDVFVVGDTHQSIYGWNGADPSLLDRLGERWPAVETIRLDRTHRSTPQITRAAASIIRAAALPDRHPAATGAPGLPATLRRHPDEVAEVTALAAAIRRRRDPSTPWSAFAVLARTHDQVLDVERGLAAVGIPASVRRPESRVRAEERDQHHRADDDRWTGDPPGDAVTVSTIHAAKGLEWPVVHIVGCEDGSIPHVSARRKDARAEEARLLYVAITRAILEVHLHWAEQRTIRGVRRQRERSPFLVGFEEASADPAAGEPVDAAHARIRTLRGLVQPPADPDPLLAALRAWRTGRARAARTDPHVVLDDQTLHSIAATRPTTTEDLASVPGLGASRATRYAPELIPLIRRTSGPS